MTKTIFNLIDDITVNKVAWEQQSEEDRKQFVPFMVNKFLSMNISNIDVVNELQQFTANLPPKHCYQVYLGILPKAKSYGKYIGSKKEKQEKQYSKLIAFLQETLGISQNESEEYLEIIFNTDQTPALIEFIKKFGYNEQELQKLFNLPESRDERNPTTKSSRVVKRK